MCFITTAPVVLAHDHSDHYDKCRVLVLRGGGVHGAFEVGALKAFIEKLDPTDYAYDYLSGVSIGAINAAILALYPKGKEAEALLRLEDFYLTSNLQDYFEYRPWY